MLTQVIPFERLGEQDTDMVAFGPGVCLRSVRMRFDRNEEIFGEGEKAEYVYRVVSGAVRTMRFTQDGRRQILAFHMPGEFFGIEPGAAHGLTAEAVCDAEVMMVRRSLLNKAAEDDPAAGRALLSLTAQCLASAREHALILGRKGAGERVAAFLLRFAECRQEMDLPMSRADIADYLALTIESVSRAFTEMERQAAIELPSARHVVMRSRSALAHLQAA